MKLTYICSPCRGDYEKNIIKAQEYCREAMNDGLLPLAPHVYFTQFVDDTNPEERKLGLRCGLQLLRHCQLIRVYGCEVSAGMYDEIQLAGVLDIEIQVFGPPEFIENVLEIYNHAAVTRLCRCCIRRSACCRSTTRRGRQESQRGYCGSYQHRSDGGLRTRRNDCEQPEKWQLNVERGRVI